ncbi:hypothetical protein EXIGLDRAFT_308297 [Exidia glandulosa HHB12029]|uniref:Zn(2)-C6 fungal-type domain-containing protein n=1 Tax=Exidia glandulosa HHB12029 TaxID=1314781 RepID=A0A165LW26_EXIGL|nr:hypothetical protein EXIGLDRAFT_308297 [Exidia glandulosa HHB12029]
MTLHATSSEADPLHLTSASSERGGIASSPPKTHFSDAQLMFNHNMELFFREDCRLFEDDPTPPPRPRPSAHTPVTAAAPGHVHVKRKLSPATDADLDSPTLDTQPAGSLFASEPSSQKAILSRPRIGRPALAGASSSSSRSKPYALIPKLPCTRCARTGRECRTQIVGGACSACRRLKHKCSISVGRGHGQVQKSEGRAKF